jgi:hypothetical protein
MIAAMCLTPFAYQLRQAREFRPLSALQSIDDIDQANYQATGEAGHQTLGMEF